MNTLETKVAEFNELITTDQTIKAMELFYADNVELRENESELRVGKQVCIDREKKALAQYDLFIEITGQAINEVSGFVFSEYRMLITEKASKKIIERLEVSVQQWEDGLIKKEKFYYNQVSLLKS